MIEPIKAYIKQGKATAEVSIDKTGDFIIKFDGASPQFCKSLIDITDQFIKQNCNNGMDNSCFNVDTFEKGK